MTQNMFFEFSQSDSNKLYFLLRAIMDWQTQNQT